MQCVCKQEGNNAEISEVCIAHSEWLKEEIAVARSTWEREIVIVSDESGAVVAVKLADTNDKLIHLVWERGPDYVQYMRRKKRDDALQKIKALLSDL